MINILISSHPLTDQSIASWPKRFVRLINRHGLFQYILAPQSNVKKGKTFHVTKKKFLSYRFFKEYQIKYRIASSYFKVLNHIISKHNNEKINILIIDDVNLLKSFVFFKRRHRDKDLKIIFSFHGHEFKIDPSFLPDIDKVLFLTHLGYKKTLENYFSFTPLVEVVGNGIDSGIFFPVSSEEKLELRKKLNLPTDKKIITWLANDRPSKGKHLFGEIINRLNNKYDHLFFLLIGSSQKFIKENIFSTGKLLPHNLAPYLQASDFYFHTALVKEGFGLTIAEALKSGNIVLASEMGGIPEVIQNYLNKRAFLVQYPNIVENWIMQFEQIMHRDFVDFSKEESKAFWDYEEWENKMLRIF